MTETDHSFDAASGKLFPKIVHVTCDNNTFREDSFWQSATFQLSSPVSERETESTTAALRDILAHYYPSFFSGEYKTTVADGNKVQFSRDVRRDPPGNMEILTRETGGLRNAVELLNMEIQHYKVAQHEAHRSKR